MNELKKISQKVSEFEKAIGDFVRTFELVFDNDWSHTQHSISNKDFIPPGATFIQEVEDANDNWANYVHLLDSYRQLVKLLDKYNIAHSVEDYFADE